MTSSVGSIPAQLARATPATFKQALFVAVTAGLGYGFDSYAVNIYGLVLPDIKRTLHITDAEAGYIGSIFLLGYTIGTIGFGYAADRWGRKTTLGASILLYGITTSVAGLTANVAAFTGLRFLTGVGGAGELAVGAPYTAEVWPAKTRALGVGGVIFSFFSLGYVLAAAVALALVPHFGWQSAFIVSIVPAIILFLARRGIKESHRYTDVQTKVERGVAKPRLWKLPGVRRRLVAGWLIYTANAVGYWGLTVFLTTYIVKRFHASPIDAIRYALVFFLLQVVFVYLGTALADWVGRRPSAILAAVIEFFSTILAATSHSLDRYLVFGAIAIATLGWLWGVGDTYVSELFPTVLRGTGFGIAVGGGRVVSIAAPAVVGWGITHYGLQTPYLALAGLWVLTVAGYLLGPETKGKELEDLADEALTEDLVSK
ncbi:MFS transporter [Mycobacterium paraense]|uniref:MFS transporter n=1 Tax=Mycobacterium paraense TaxID=767916 RepID=A0A1X2A723_9MYCO|nr:MFS transporter [Mycobacterium paraense]MCV7444220.1 MFS transporter [Mycobacterium paraense]ORW32778.1 MFS transporter [Mycobacterium paraense]ORW43087.1 MFS transporter [Mycobacterium paraense]ORW44478.1 MFS transporter [Mycobacterium paraense]ORW45004.1 MFS transporter [Mycobacterium paraense]